jgi:hypothetical protein
MNCVIYEINVVTQRSKFVGFLTKHTDMNNWIKTNGYKEHVYEIWKGLRRHSSWCWKENKKRWGKMSTPIKKKQIIEEEWGVLFQKK